MVAGGRSMLPVAARSMSGAMPVANTRMSSAMGAVWGGIDDGINGVSRARAMACGHALHYLLLMVQIPPVEAWVVLPTRG
jgi:hypothetical protein